MKKLIAIFAALLAFVPHFAKAEVFVWEDGLYKIAMTYPDNWMRQAQLDPDLRLFVLAPQGMDHAACRLSANHDGRFMDAPSWAGADVSAYVFNTTEVQRVLYAERRDTNMVQVTGYTPNASLGSGAAVMAEASFQKQWSGKMYPMHALVVASQYHGNRIFVSCETLAGAWPKWESTMKAIVKSISFPPAFATEPNGLYRRFQDDGEIYLPLNRRSDGFTTR